MRPSEQAKAGGFFRPRRLGHANLFVSDYERASQFYQSVVGFEEVYRQPDNRASFLSNGNTYHDLGLTDVHSKYAAKDQKPGMWHLAFELETEADLVDGYLGAGVLSEQGPHVLGCRRHPAPDDAGRPVEVLGTEPHALSLRHGSRRCPLRLQA